MRTVFESSVLRPCRRNRGSIIHRQLCRIFPMQVLGHFSKWILLCRRDCAEEGNSVRNIHLQRTALLRQLATSIRRIPFLSNTRAAAAIAFSALYIRYSFVTYLQIYGFCISKRITDAHESRIFQMSMMSFLQRRM